MVLDISDDVWRRFSFLVWDTVIPGYHIYINIRFRLYITFYEKITSVSVVDYIITYIILQYFSMACCCSKDSLLQARRRQD